MFIHSVRATGKLGCWRLGIVEAYMKVLILALAIPSGSELAGRFHFALVSHTLTTVLVFSHG